MRRIATPSAESTRIVRPIAVEGNVSYIDAKELFPDAKGQSRRVNRLKDLDPIQKTAKYFLPATDKGSVTKGWKQHSKREKHMYIPWVNLAPSWHRRVLLKLTKSSCNKQERAEVVRFLDAAEQPDFQHRNKSTVVRMMRHVYYGRLRAFIFLMRRAGLSANRKISDITKMCCPGGMFQIASISFYATVLPRLIFNRLMYCMIDNLLMGELAIPGVRIKDRSESIASIARVLRHYDIQSTECGTIARILVRLRRSRHENRRSGTKWMNSRSL